MRIQWYGGDGIPHLAQMHVLKVYKLLCVSGLIIHFTFKVNSRLTSAFKTT